MSSGVWYGTTDHGLLRHTSLLVRVFDLDRELCCGLALIEAITISVLIQDLDLYRLY